MVVNVKYITNVREITKKQDEKIELGEGSTVRNLIDKLVVDYGPKLKEIILPRGADKVSVFVGILGNGKSFQPLSRLDTKLKDGNTILIGLPVMGG